MLSLRFAVTLLFATPAFADVVAAAPDWTYAVARDGAVDIVSPHDKRTLPLGKGRIGLSAAGTKVAFVDDTGLELWEGTRRWRVALDEQSWGAPAFVGDRIVTHHRGHATVWDASGKRVCTITDPALTTARESFPLGGNRFALRCGTDQPHLANASLFVIDGCKVVDRLRAGASHVLPGDVTAGAFVQVGNRSVPSGADDVSALARSPDGKRVSWGLHNGEVHAWTGDRIEIFKTGRSSAIAVIRDDGATLHAVDFQGGVYDWKPGAGAPVKPRVLSPSDLSWQRALVRLALGDLDGALKLTPAAMKLPQLYIASLQSNEDGAAFLERCRRAKVNLADDATLELVADLIATQEPSLAADLYFSYLDAAPSPPARAEGLGNAVGRLLSDAEDDETRTALRARMNKSFPKSRPSVER